MVIASCYFSLCPVGVHTSREIGEMQGIMADADPTKRCGLPLASERTAVGVAILNNVQKPRINLPKEHNFYGCKTIPQW